MWKKITYYPSCFSNGKCYECNKKTEWYKKYREKFKEVRKNHICPYCGKQLSKKQIKHKRVYCDTCSELRRYNGIKCLKISINRLKEFNTFPLKLSDIFFKQYEDVERFRMNKRFYTSDMRRIIKIIKLENNEFRIITANGFIYKGIQYKNQVLCRYIKRNK